MNSRHSNGRRNRARDAPTVISVACPISPRNSVTRSSCSAIRPRLGGATGRDRLLRLGRSTELGGEDDGFCSTVVICPPLTSRGGEPSNDPFENRIGLRIRFGCCDFREVVHATVLLQDDHAKSPRNAVEFRPNRGVECFPPIQLEPALFHDLPLGKLNEEVLRQSLERHVVRLTSAASIHRDNGIGARISVRQACALDIELLPSGRQWSNPKSDVVGLKGAPVERRFAATKATERQHEASNCGCFVDPPGHHRCGGTLPWFLGAVAILSTRRPKFALSWH